MSKIKTIYLAFTTLGLLACESDFISNYDNSEKTIVVEGWITDLDQPQRIKLTKSQIEPFLDTAEYYVERGELIDDALVIISSDTQFADTLSLEIDTSIYDYGWRGYYITDKIKGIPGETFYLRVEFENKVYEASAYMPPVATLDSISFTTKKVEKENATLIVPLANFQEPVNEENYYLFRPGVFETYTGEDGQLIEKWLIYRGSDPWLISVFSDQYINGKYAQLNTNEGITTERYWMDGSIFNSPGEQIIIQMQSITKEAFEYYKVLINQLNYAAGVFHPSPASPPTNISNGGQGFFGASAVSRVYGTIPEK